jgi:hypothetical protein
VRPDEPVGLLILTGSPLKMLDPGNRDMAGKRS